MGDGHETALDELAISEELKATGTLRAEEIVLQTPGGRGVSMLVNPTPIHGEDGNVASVLFAMQDQAPLEKPERLRIEFLNMVSRELCTPLAASNGSTATVLGAPTVLDPAELRRFFRVVNEQADHMQGLIADLLDVGRIEEGMLSVSPAPSESGLWWRGAERAGRQAAGAAAFAVARPRAWRSYSASDRPPSAAIRAARTIVKPAKPAG